MFKISRTAFVMLFLLTTSLFAQQPQTYQWVTGSPGNVPAKRIPFGATNVSNTPGQVAMEETCVARGVNHDNRNYIAFSDGQVAKSVQTAVKYYGERLMEYSRSDVLVPAPGYSAVWQAAGREMSDVSLSAMRAVKLDIGIPNRGLPCSGYVIRFNDGSGNIVPAIYGNIKNSRFRNRCYPLDNRRLGIGTLEVLTMQSAGTANASLPTSRSAKPSIVKTALGPPGNGPSRFQLIDGKQGHFLTAGTERDERNVGVAANMGKAPTPNSSPMDLAYSTQVWALLPAQRGRFSIRSNGIGGNKSGYLDVQTLTGNVHVTSAREGDAEQLFAIEEVSAKQARRMVSPAVFSIYESADSGAAAFVRIKESTRQEYLLVGDDRNVVRWAPQPGSSQIFLLKIL